VSERSIADWEMVLEASVRMQQLVPDAVLVEGSAAGLNFGDRVSFDDDHVIRDLVERFDEVVEALEATDGGVTARVSVVGAETGIRQLIRQRPLEVEEVAGPSGAIRVPTLREMARVKGWLILQRNATRDYLDFAALADRLGPAAVSVVTEMDDYYTDQRGVGGSRIASQLARQLAEPTPYDLSELDLHHHRGLLPRWREWAEVATVCRQIAAAVLDQAGRGGVRTTMIHRHLDYPEDTPPDRLGPAAIDDLLDRGDLDDWAPLARAVAAEPWGSVAETILRLCAAHPMYGTSRLWPAYISLCRARALGGGGAS
jgi:hypothetical protein